MAIEDRNNKLKSRKNKALEPSEEVRENIAEALKKENPGENNLEFINSKHAHEEWNSISSLLNQREPITIDNAKFKSVRDYIESTGDNIEIIIPKDQNKIRVGKGKKPKELEPGTLEAANLREDLIKFLKINGFELVDSNKHEKYKNCELNVSVVVPHQQGYFSEKTFCKILREAGFSKNDYKERKNKKNNEEKIE